MSDDKKQDDKPKEIEHKVGLHSYARMGFTAPDWVIIGAPRVNNERWVTVSHKLGGPIHSYPEHRFVMEFWIPEK